MRNLFCIHIHHNSYKISNNKKKNSNNNNDNDNNSSNNNKTSLLKLLFNVNSRGVQK